MWQYNWSANVPSQFWLNTFCAAVEYCVYLQQMWVHLEGLFQAGCMQSVLDPSLNYWGYMDSNLWFVQYVCYLVRVRWWGFWKYLWTVLWHSTCVHVQLNFTHTCVYTCIMLCCIAQLVCFDNRHIIILCIHIHIRLSITSFLEIHVHLCVYNHMHTGYSLDIFLFFLYSMILASQLSSESMVMKLQVSHVVHF